MRFFSRIKVCVLVGVAFLLIGIGGCSPGPVVWRAEASPTFPPSQEEVQ